MLHFECDYNNGCHPEILKALVETNSLYTSGYGEDEFSCKAKELIRKACDCPQGQVYLLVGGTQTNEVVISSVLLPWQGVISATTGHIAVHEAGAIEYTGHKVLTLPQKDAKISAEDLKSYLQTYYNDGNYTHMVFPGMVYISFPTELGTIYKKSELEKIYSVCKEYRIPLFIDGARLGYGLTCKDCDLTLEELCKLCDIIYIGGTKVGALCGEAVVFTHANEPEHFFTMIKQKGALLAKGRLTGVQFATLFNNNLYFEISKHANESALKLRQLIKRLGIEFFYETPTNQQFVIVKNEILPELSKKVAYGFWDKYDENHTVIRFCTSWATSDDDLIQLEEVLKTFF